MTYLKKIILICLLVSQSVASQDKYSLQWYSADSNHLPQNSVKSIIKDKYGYIWLATENGLVRYDGKNFKTYNSENCPGMLSNRINTFSGDVYKDSIYFINENKQLYSISKRKPTNLNIHVRQPYMKANEIIKHNYTPLYSLFYNMEEYYTTLQALNSLYIIKNDTISLYNSKRKPVARHYYKYPPEAQFFTLGENLYFPSKDGDFVRLEIKQNSIKPVKVKTDNDFKGGVVIYNNNLAGQAFVYSGTDIYIIQEQNGSLVSQLICKGINLPAHNIMAVYYDSKNRVLYLGSANKGLLIITEQGFSTIHSEIKHAAGTNGVYYALAAFDKSSIIASTGEVFSVEKRIENSLNIGPYSDKYLLVLDNNGDLWTKIFGALYRFKKNSNFTEYDSWKFNNSITALKKGADGKIWIGVFNDAFKNGGFLYFIEPEAPHCKPKLFSKLSFAPSALSIPDNNTIWAGSWTGLYKIDITKKTETKVNDFPETHVRSIYAEKPNAIWACSYGKGFFLHRNGKTTRFPADRNEYLLTTHCIIEDGKGFLWITTNRGLFQVFKQDLYDFEAGKLTNVYYHSYNKNSGFSNNEFNGGCEPCGVYLNNETMFFPSMDGIVHFNLNDILPRLPNPPLYIDEVKINDTVHNMQEHIEIGRNFDRISFYVSSPYFGNPYNEVIETKLEGPVSQNWSALLDNNVTFSTLPPGVYTLTARKLNGFGSKWTYTNVCFEILPAFWQTSWFRTLIILLGISIVICIIRLRIRYIRHKNIQLQNKIELQTSQLQETITTLRLTKDDLSKQIINHKRLIKSITHDIKSPLKFMSITGRYIYNNFNTEKEETIKENLQAMYTSSHQLYHFVDNFLEYARETDTDTTMSQPYSLNELTGQKMSFFKNLADFTKNELINSIPQDIYLTLNRHLLSIILHNILDNAIKHTFNGSIETGGIVTDGSLLITITDTGNGMSQKETAYYNMLFEKKLPQDETKSGMGLHMIAELLIILNGKMNIESSPGTGTKISLIFNEPFNYGTF